MNDDDTRQGERGADFSGFLEAMRRLRAHPGTPAIELPALKAGIIGLPAWPASPEEVDKDAVQLARSTQFSYQTWAGALSWIKGHSQYGAILEALRGGAAVGISPQHLVVDLFGPGGVMSAYDTAIRENPE